MKPECWLTLSAPSRLLQSKQKLVPSLSQSPTHPQYPRRHHPSHRVRHYACLMQARARRSPCANRTRCPNIRAKQAFVVCASNRPFGGSGPLVSGPSPCGAALRPPWAWASPLILFAGVLPAREQRGRPRTGEQEKRGFPPFSSSPSFSIASRLSVTVRSQAQCLSQPTRLRNEANRLFDTHSPAGSRQPSINLFNALITIRFTIGTRTGQTSRQQPHWHAA